MTDSRVKILVVEDDPKHFGDAVRYVRQLQNCEVTYVDSLDRAVSLLEDIQFDGIISDVFFPAIVGGDADTYDNALTLANLAFEKKIHLVFNTSGNHHGEKYSGFQQEKSKIQESRLNQIEIKPFHFLSTLQVIESYPKGANEDKDYKQWEAAFRYIFIVFESFKTKVYPTWNEKDDDHTFMNFPNGDYGELTQRFRDTQNPFALSVFAKYCA